MNNISNNLCFLLKNYKKFLIMNLWNLILMNFFMMFMDIPVLNLFSDVSELGCMDDYSYSLFLLTLWIFFICLMMLLNNKFSILLILLLLLMLICLLLSFYLYNLLLFFISFEFSMFPIILIIIIWGVSKNRFLSSYYLMFYTLLFSLPFFLNLLILKSTMMSFSWYYLTYIKIDWFNLLFVVFFLMIFMVKLPLYLFHLWLLKAHVDAPVYGSMILASILLKLGGYGLIRVINIIYFSLININDFFIYLSLFGSLICSLKCLRQLDMKILVAYSSVIHMNFMLSGLMTLTLIGLKSCMILMIGHGLCSSAMFYMVNIWYLRSGSRILLLNKGFMVFMPSMILLWFLICSSNMAAPISLNLIGEIFIFCSLISMNYKLMYILMMISFFSVIFSLYLFIFIQHGNSLFYYMKFNSGMMVEYFIVLLHWLPLNLLILNLIFF